MFAASKTDSASTGGYQISRSLRFNSADSASLSRTPATATDRKTWTWSGWVKRALLSSGNQMLFSAGSSYTAQTNFAFYIRSDDVLVTTTGAFEIWRTTQVFRDPSAWYHMVLVVDTTQATANNRTRLYINGTEVTSFNRDTNLSLNTDYGINDSIIHYIGQDFFQTIKFGGYMTEINFIDGQALTPSSFGETNAQTGVWQPKAYSGSYGTNGFYVNFSDNSNTTAATLGKDYSGNGNNWTPNNFSVSAGAGNDSMVDVPTPYGLDTGAGGTVRGNYCTLNPLATGSGKVLVNGNLDFTSSTSNWYFSLGTIGFSSGKYYWEVNMGSTNGSDIFAGIMGTGIPVNGDNGLQDNVTALNTFGSLLFCDDGKYQLDGNTGRVAYSTALGSNQTLGIAVDMDTKSLTFYKDGVSQGAISFSSSPMASSFVLPSFSSYATTDSARVFNFGQRPFAYTAPSGFKALCTQNLPTPTIGATTATQAGKFFNTVLYTGNNSTQSITGVGFQPDFIWIKYRPNSGTSHTLVNAVTGNTKYLFSNTNASEETVSDAVTSFNSDGFSLGANNSGVLPFVNYSLGSYVAWNWKASNTTAVSNTAGSITSTVSANTTSKFSVVTYTGNGGTNQSIGHGLGATPSMVIIKNRTLGTANWLVHHQSQPTGYTLYLNLTNAEDSGTSQWGTTPQTSALFYVGFTAGATGSNNNGDAYVAYCFAPISGYSAFGSYIGNGSENGPFVFIGFKPAFLMIKRTNASSNAWIMYDGTRNTSNLTNKKLGANLSDEENNGANLGGDSIGIDFLSNGFKSVTQTGSNQNAYGATYIYAAFASTPFKYSLAR